MNLKALHGKALFPIGLILTGIPNNTCVVKISTVVFAYT